MSCGDVKRTVRADHSFKAISCFNDEVLRGEWKGHRSSRPGLKYRVIYRIEADQLYVMVLEVTPHDYRRR